MGASGAEGREAARAGRQRWAPGTGAGQGAVCQSRATAFRYAQTHCSSQDSVPGRQSRWMFPVQRELEKENG